MNPKQVGALRRAVIYSLVGYGGLTVINNTRLAPERMWLAYTPLFVGVYFFARWADARIAASGQTKDE